MIQKSLIAVCLITIAVVSCTVKSDTNWGKSVCGCQLSIALSTNIIETGHSATFYFRIKNLSSTRIQLNFDTKPRAFLVLTNASGKSYQLAPLVDAERNISNYLVDTNDVGEWSFRVKFGEYFGPGGILLDPNGLPPDTVITPIEPGDYIFVPITRDITTLIDGKVCTLTSNSLKIKVVE